MFYFSCLQFFWQIEVCIVLRFVATVVYVWQYAAVVLFVLVAKVVVLAIWLGKAVSIFYCFRRLFVICQMVRKSKQPRYITSYLCQILSYFRSSFAGTFSSTFAMKWWLNISPRFKRCAALPGQSYYSKTHLYFSRYYTKCLRFNEIQIYCRCIYQWSSFEN